MDRVDSTSCVSGNGSRKSQIEPGIRVLGANSLPVLRIVTRPRSPNTSCDTDTILRGVIQARREGIRFPRVRHELILPPGPPHIPLAVRTSSVPVQVPEPEAEADPDEDTAFAHSFKAGDRVMVRLSVEELRLMQIRHGGFNDKLAECIGRVGVIHRFTDGGDARVMYGDVRFTINPAALETAPTVVGDVVRINNDINKVKKWQFCHGGWGDLMARDLGKLGTVVEIYPDGDLEVQIGDNSWTLNPLCVKVTNHMSAYPAEAAGDSTHSARHRHSP